MTDDVESGQNAESLANIGSDRTRIVLAALDKRANEEIRAESDGRTSARKIGPAYRALLSTLPKSALNRNDMLVNRLVNWTKRAQRSADTIVRQGVEGISSDPDFAFQKVVSEEIYPFELSEDERQALEQASVDESERQKSNTQQADGMAISIKVKPERMLADTLFEVGDVLQDE